MTNKEKEQLNQMIKKMNLLKQNESKSSQYFRVLSFLAKFKNSYELMKEYKLYPAPDFVSFSLSLTSEMKNMSDFIKNIIYENTRD